MTNNNIHTTNIVGAWVEDSNVPCDDNWTIIRMEGVKKGEFHYHVLSPERDIQLAPFARKLITAWAYITGPNFKKGEE